jgi:predicted GNAT family acetyltransferase
MAEDLEFETAGRRYRVTRKGAEVAFSDVDPIGADALLIKHTEVSPAIEGQGVGFAKAFIQRHPEYQDLVRR